MVILHSKGQLLYTSKAKSYKIWYDYPLHTKICPTMFKRFIYKFKGKVYEEYSEEFKTLIEKELFWRILSEKDNNME